MQATILQKVLIMFSELDDPFQLSLEDIFKAFKP